MDELQKPRPRKQTLSAIIEKIVLEKQRQKEKAIFEQQLQQLEAQRNVTIAKIEACELIDDSSHEPRAAPNPFELPARPQAVTQGADCQTAEAMPLGAAAPPAAAPPSQEDDEDMDEDDATDKEDANIDPERLKAFNMFVRLFADEQLDRTIPISKQPKERIQTIIDSCNRQFPEFEDRARKRLRTYLKACRRHKKLKEPLSVSDVSSFGRLTRLTPAHLNSLQANMILAQACQNETRGAKRRHSAPETAAQAEEEQLMQLPSVMPQEPTGLDAPTTDNPAVTPAPAPVPSLDPAPSPAAAGPSLAQTSSLAPDLAPAPAVAQPLASPPIAPAPAFAPPVAPAAARVPERSYSQDTPLSGVPAHQPAASAFYQTDVGQLLRQVLPGRSGGPAPPSHAAGGELFFRRAPQAPLNFAEAVAVRALADGYRQSASLLRRTADELEALLPQGML